MLKHGFLIVVGTMVGACHAPAADVETTAQASERFADAERHCGRPLGARCDIDRDCNGGVTGTGRVCSNAGREAGTCIVGCHGDFDCPDGDLCDQHVAPHWQCQSTD